MQKGKRKKNAGGEIKRRMVKREGKGQKYSPPVTAILYIKYGVDSVISS